MLTFVKVNKSTQPYSSTSKDRYNFIGIVRGTNSQLYNTSDIKSYSVYKLENDKVVNVMSWFDESQLELLDYQDRDLAEEKIEEYNLR